MVWGKEVVVIRDDYLMLRQEFWDQDGVLVKADGHHLRSSSWMTAYRRYAMRMHKLEDARGVDGDVGRQYRLRYRR